MIIFANNISPRLRYTIDFIGKMITGSDASISSDTEIFRQYDGPKINYSKNKIVAEELWIIPHNLLAENDVRFQQIDCSITGDQISFFKTGGELGFDLFAAVFYLLSRYEEYLPHEKDSYGRFSHTSSIAFKSGFLQRPIINIWINDLQSLLVKKFPSFKGLERSFEFLPTYDIDEAFAYRNKGILRNAGGIIKDILSGRDLKSRVRVLNGKATDPYDSFEWMDQVNTRFQLKPVYFFLVPGKTGKYDKPVLATQPAMQEIIKRHAGKYRIGIHPSWQSGDDPVLIKKEKETIEKISGQGIKSSRQHYIRFSLPSTFRELINAGITEDYSMGYGSINGFRASVATPYYWYDLQNERPTKLLLFPFCYMEANSYFEQKYSTIHALDEMRGYYETLKQIKGKMIVIWHNTFLGSSPLFKGWKEIYEQFLEEINT